jgi:hypothetical protein
MPENRSREQLLETIDALETRIAYTPSGDPGHVVDRLVDNAVLRSLLAVPVGASGEIRLDLSLVAEQLDRMLRSDFEPSVVRVPPRSWANFLRDPVVGGGPAPSGAGDDKRGAA